MMAVDPTIFPAINATMNGLSAVLLLAGRSLIRRRRIEAHKRVMIAACISSTLFLCDYLYYHIHYRLITHFAARGWPRPVYFAVLASHTVLAVAVVPLVLMSLTRGLKRQDAKHRAISRWTYPVWLYVSVTGVLIYFMLYHWFRA